MAKLFPIGIEVEETAVGSVLRILNKTPGVAKLHLNLLNEGPTEVEAEATTEIQNVLPPVKPPKQGSTQMIIAKILSVAPCHNKVLREALKRNDFSETSLPSQLNQMVSKGFVTKVGVGTWRLTNRGRHHYGFDGIKALPKKSEGSSPRINNGFGVRKLVLTSLQEKDLLAKELGRILQEHKYSPKNMTGTVGKMRQEGLVQSLGGLYRLTDQGRSALNEVVAEPMEKNS